MASTSEGGAAEGEGFKTVEYTKEQTKRKEQKKEKSGIFKHKDRERRVKNKQ